MNWRLVFVGLVALGLAPGTWVRSPPQAGDYRDRMAFHPLDVQPQALGQLQLERGWQMTSNHAQFGSYSALELLEDGTLLAGSDRGWLVRFSMPGAGGAGGDNNGKTVRFLGKRGARTERKDYRDLESLTRDPVTGTVWAAYESSNAIVRLDSDFAEAERVRPEAMRDWAGNSGPEAMLRLADGRFLVIAEGRPGTGDETMPALLFADDPLKGGEPMEFAFEPPLGFRPVDAAQLPDGRVLVLVRRVNWELPPGFENAIVLADPADINEGETWRGSEVARIAKPLPTDNYEGMAVVARPDGTATLWLISDHNSSTFQRTLLLKLSVPTDF